MEVLGEACVRDASVASWDLRTWDVEGAWRRLPAEAGRDGCLTVRVLVEGPRSPGEPRVIDGWPAFVVHSQRFGAPRFFVDPFEGLRGSSVADPAFEVVPSALVSVLSRGGRCLSRMMRMASTLE